MLETIRRPLVLIALIAALAAALLSRSPSAGHGDLYDKVQGKNNTVLFLVNANHGYTNVHLATAHTLLERHPSVKLHFGTFEKMRERVRRIEESGARANPEAQGVPFHLMPAEDYVDALRTHGIMSLEEMIVPPGMAGNRYLSKNFRWIFSPWLQDDHLAIYRRCRELIDEIDPSLVVLDPMFRPAREAVADAKRLYAVVSPMTLEEFLTNQPWGKWIWKYPMVSTGFGYPLPWTKIHQNLFVTLNMIYSILTLPGIGETRSFLEANGVGNPLDLMSGQHRPDAPWITQAMREAAVPLEYLPPNVSAVGPIVLSLAPAREQDAEMAGWLERAPTVLVNLGTLFKYHEERAYLMVKAVKNVLERTNVQVLWKVVKAGEYGDEFKDEVQRYVEEGRLRIVDWLTVDPAALVESGHIVASVHHGGSNCYHEALSAGIPQVILPVWFDLYDFATYAEYYGIGVWGCRETSPEWTVKGLTDAFMSGLDDGDAGMRMREEAKRLGEMARARPGREEAARLIAELAGSGKA